MRKIYLMINAILFVVISKQSVILPIFQDFPRKTQKSQMFFVVQKYFDIKTSFFVLLLFKIIIIH